MLWRNQVTRSRFEALLWINRYSQFFRNFSNRCKESSLEGWCHSHEAWKKWFSDPGREGKFLRLTLLWLMVLYGQWVQQMNSEAAPLHTPGELREEKSPVCSCFYRLGKGRSSLLRTMLRTSPHFSPPLFLVVSPLLLNFLLFLSSVAGICFLFF